MTTWKRYADNRIAYAKTHANHLVLYVLNLFHTKIKFTYEIEDSSEITFLVVLLARTCSDIGTTVYQKPTNNSMYLYWDPFPLESWKRGTFLRAHVVSSNQYMLEKEITQKQICIC